MLWLTLEVGHVAMPLVLGAFALPCRERHVRAVRQREVAEGVERRFGLTMQQFHDMTTKRNVDLEPLSWAPLAPSALAGGAPAKAGPSASSSVAKPGPMRIHRGGASTAAPALSDHKIHELNRKSKRARYLSHTDRYEQDDVCRANCIQNHYLKWLQWVGRFWARRDGADDRG